MIATTQATVLLNEMTGRWVVSTRSSRYVVDLDQRTVTRSTRGRTDDPEWAAKPLRGDGRPLKLGHLITCMVGRPARIHIEGLNPPDMPRVTTPVTSIAPMGD